MHLTRRRLARASAFATLAVAALVMSCTEPLAPSDIDGVYALRTLRGETLPTPLRAGDTDGPILLADTLVLSADGSGLWIDVYEFEPVFAGEPKDTVRFIMAVQILQQGGQLLLAERFVCQPGFDCREPETYPIGRWQGELVLGDGPRYYARVND